LLNDGQYDFDKLRQDLPKTEEEKIVEDLADQAA